MTPVEALKKPRKAQYRQRVVKAKDRPVAASGGGNVVQIDDCRDCKIQGWQFKGSGIVAVCAKLRHREIPVGVRKRLPIPNWCPKVKAWQKKHRDILNNVFEVSEGLKYGLKRI